MRSSVCSALSTAAIVHGLSTDHDRRRGQRCTVLTHPVSLIHRGIYIDWYNDDRPHSSLNDRTPTEVWLESLLPLKEAA